MIARQVRNLELQAGLGVDLEFARLRLFRDDDDDTIGALAAVDGSGGSIFEDVDALDLLIVVVHEFGERDFEAVHDDQRRVGVVLLPGVEGLHAGGQRGVAADVDVGQVVGVGAIDVVDGEVDAGICILQCLQQVLSTELLQLLLADGAHRARVALLGFPEDAGDDHVVERLGVFVESDPHLFLQGYDACLHTHIAHLYVATALEEVVEGEGTVEVGDRQNLGADNPHLRSDDGLFGFCVVDITAHRLHFSLLDLDSTLLPLDDVDELALDGIAQWLAAQHIVDNLEECGVVYHTTDAVGLQVLVGEKEFVAGVFLQPQQYSRQ